eukprot:Opistho-2@15510
MVRPLLKIYGYSYEAMCIYGRKDLGFGEWVSERKRINLGINTEVFTYIGKAFATGTASTAAFSQQFCLDVFSGQLKKHFRHRYATYQTCHKMPFLKKELFMWLSLWHAGTDVLKDLFVSLRGFRCRFGIDYTGVSGKVAVCIGFPEHAFSYDPHEMKYPKSFVEYLISKKNLAGSGEQFLTIDEYQRPSKKHETAGNTEAEAFLPMEFAHTKLAAVTEIMGWGTAIRLFFRECSNYWQRTKKPGLFLLVAYIRQSLTARRYLSMLEALTSKNVSISRIYILAFHELGLLKYGSAYDKLIEVYSYSQNFFVPPSKEVSRNMLNQQTVFEGDALLEECDLPVFSFYARNPIGFAFHSVLINCCKEYVNGRFGLRLPLASYDISEAIPVNLGYETYCTLTLTDQEKAILVFDVPTESDNKDLGRSIIGDKTAKPDFLGSFFTDIVYLSRKYNCKIFLKPKYSLSSPELPEDYKSMIGSIQKELGPLFSLINPYSNIRIAGNPVDLVINFPYTSTYYSMADICKKSVFFCSGYLRG